MKVTTVSIENMFQPAIDVVDECRDAVHWGLIMAPSSVALLAEAPFVAVSYLMDALGPKRTVIETEEI